MTQRTPLAPVPAQTIEALCRELDRCMALARSTYGRNFATPSLSLKLRGHTAGTAQASRWRIRLNHELLLKNPQEMVSQTLPHEIAHLIDAAVRPPTPPRRGSKRARRVLHGASWKAVMRLFGVPADRCHDMPTTAAIRRVRRRHEYRCPSCGQSVLVGPKHHKRMSRGKIKMRIRACGHVLSREHFVREIVLPPAVRGAIS